MNNEPIRTLMIDDSEDDVLLIIRELKRHGYNPAYERIDTADAMKKALRERQWDIILCDYKMPHFSGPSAISLLKETKVDIPIIIISGTINEETAVNCLHLGARDYIKKSNLSRLCPAIVREMEQSKVKNNEKQEGTSFRKSEDRFKTQYQVSPVPTFIWRKTGNDFMLLECNDAALTIAGENVKRCIHKRAREIYTEQDDILLDIYRCFEGRTVIKRELKSKHFMPGRDMVCTYTFVPDDLVMVHVEDITERKNAEAKIGEKLESLRRSLYANLQLLASAVEIRDPYTAGHQSRVALLACAIAAEMGMPQDKIEGIHLAGSVHDAGKLSVPAEILARPTLLTKPEFSLIMEHPLRGYEILKDVESPWPLAQIVFQHHERMNGSGYPMNLKGDKIILGARILAVADVVEAMSSHRSYRAAPGIGKAMEEIEKNRGILYDSAVADACVRLFREKGYRLV
jgi:HD-GYP domain-containing protein (c-di-GMP phosphodiesterase class II)/FixJ family two-component response regulator